MIRSASSPTRPLGATLAPVLLRIVLAVTFIWAGLGKLMARMPVDAQQVATLASMGVSIDGPSIVPAPIPTSPSTPASPPSGTDSAPPSGPTEPIPTPRPAHSPVAPTPAERAVRPDGSPTNADPAPPPSAPATEPARDAAPREPATQSPATPPAPTAVAPTVRRMWGLALRIHDAAHPRADESGRTPMKLWPATIGNGNWPRYFAIAVVFAELGGGILVGLGLLTRLGAASLAGVMLGAIWLDQIGPAMQAGNPILLILPAHDAWDVAAWRPLLWQLSLLGCAGALVLLGAGAPSLDRALGWFRGRGDDDDL